MKMTTEKIQKKFMERDLYSVEQAAHRLGISRSRIKPELIATGRLGVVTVLGKMKIPRTEIENFIKENTVYNQPYSLKLRANSFRALSGKL